MKIIHLSDLHISENNFKGIKDMLLDLVEYKNIKEYNIVITGDFTDNHTKKDLFLVKKIMKILEDAKEIHVTAGNHDYFSFFGNGFFSDKKAEKEFNNLFSIEGYPIVTITKDNYSFIGINSAHAEFFASGKIGKKQRERLISVLKQESIKKAKKRIIYLHHHAFDLSFKWYQIWKILKRNVMRLEDSKKFLKILKDYNVEMVLHGHKHSKLGKRVKNKTCFFNGGSSSGKGSLKGVSLIEISDKTGEVSYEERWNFYE